MCVIAAELLINVIAIIIIIIIIILTLVVMILHSQCFCKNCSELQKLWPLKC